MIDIDKMCKGLPKEALEEIKRYFQSEVRRIESNIEALEEERKEVESYIVSTNLIRKDKDSKKEVEKIGVPICYHCGKTRAHYTQQCTKCGKLLSCHKQCGMSYKALCQTCLKEGRP